MPDGEPRMEIRKVGRWTYELSWHPRGDWIGIECGRVLGRKRADRVAVRQLQRLSGSKPIVSVAHLVDVGWSPRSGSAVILSDMEG